MFNLEGISDHIQDKAPKVADIYKTCLEVGMEGFDPLTVKVDVNALPTKLDEEGRFFVITGTKLKPKGIGVDNSYPLVLVYNERYAMFVPTAIIRKCIKENIKSLTIDIDKTYSAMGVWLNLGVISSYLDEGFVTASHQFFEHDF
jgi:hypothetical protein